MIYTAFLINVGRVYGMRTLFLHQRDIRPGSKIIKYFLLNCLLYFCYAVELLKKLLLESRKSRTLGVCETILVYNLVNIGVGNRKQKTCFTSKSPIRRADLQVPGHPGG